MNRIDKTVRQGRRTRHEPGQVLVVFALALIAIVAMTGLVLDGGSTFVQRRDQQNVADAAVMAAAYAYAMTGDTGAATTAAQSTAASNGYSTGTGGVSVTVTNASAGPGWNFTAYVSKPHANNFTGLLGMPSWGVTATATSLSGRPNAAVGALPIIFSNSAFSTNGSGNSHDVWYEEPDPGNQDVPIAPNKFNWTEFCNNCNADSNTVRNLIDNHASDTSTVEVGWKISPLNNGSHTTLFSSLADWVGHEFAVPIVDANGYMVGFATFHLTGSVGGSTKKIKGYFVSPANWSALTISSNAGDGGDYGSYTVELIN